MKQKISAIIPTYNEEAFIEGALDNVAFADEVIVIDSYSTDRTVALAEGRGARVLLRVFDDFSSQKNFAIERASYDWILVLDADERVSEELKVEMEQVLNNPSDKVGYFVYRTLYFLGRKISYGGWQTDKVMRLFNRKHCRYDGRLVHERISYEGKAGWLKNRLDHYSYRSFDHYMFKLNHYATLQARSLYERGAMAHVVQLVFKPPFRFFVHYVVRLGLLDGFPGFVLASQHAFGVLTRYTKLWSLNRDRKRSHDRKE